MRIEKRTMNWLPRPSLFNEAEAARLKRKAHAQADLSTSAAMNTALISANTSNTGESINLTLRVAAARIQSAVNKKV
jgi:hypothetical protein